eukprot:TRINITY_DN67798_c0_g1_i1.p1 TRINITY_DN67798_c0_g1~~TRINITY_DN67798_c0_g1_i1.p1  ORF type:complete len:105 (-),score=13.20 TRINITY_DN67798_c0_g1_i1:87-401(-)
MQGLFSQVPVAQDIVQAVLVSMSIFAGWTVWSLLLDLLTPSSPFLAVPAPVKPSSMVVTNLSSEAAADVRCPVGKDDQSGFALLEHYGVFGVPAGSWSDKAQHT